MYIFGKQKLHIPCFLPLTVPLTPNLLCYQWHMCCLLLMLQDKFHWDDWTHSFLVRYWRTENAYISPNILKLDIMLSCGQSGGLMLLYTTSNYMLVPAPEKIKIEKYNWSFTPCYEPKCFITCHIWEIEC